MPRSLSPPPMQGGSASASGSGNGRYQPITIRRDRMYRDDYDPEPAYDRERERERDYPPQGHYRPRGHAPGYSPARYREPERERDWRDEEWERGSRYHRGGRGGYSTNYRRDNYRDRERERDDRDWDYSATPIRPRSRRGSITSDDDSPPTQAQARNKPANARAITSRSPTRSGSPEEGQITSTSPLPTATHGATGLPARPRSPPPMSMSMSRHRSRSRSPPPFRRYDRDRSWQRDREAERERDWDRERERDRYHVRRSRSPFSPPPRPIRRRSPSISSVSSYSRSSRPSPVKRNQSPPPPPPSSSHHPQLRRESISKSHSPEKKPLTRFTSPLPQIAQPVAQTQSQTPMQTRAPFQPPTGPRIPPSAPRSERLPLLTPPTGPRALAHLTNATRGPPPSAPRVNPYAPNPTSQPPPPPPPPTHQVENPPPIASAEVVNPYARPIPSGPSGSGAPRLSWSERKTIVSPTTSAISPQSQRQQTSTPQAGSDTPLEEETKPVINPYAHAKPTLEQRSSSDAISSSLGNRTPAPPPPPAAAAAAEPESVEMEVIKSHVKEEAANPEVAAVPIVSEAELAERHAREEEARILASLPALKVPFGGTAWEIELAQHNQHSRTLLQATLRAKAAHRHAAMVLADAELERAASGERRKICESQLAQASFSVGVGILGV